MKRGEAIAALLRAAWRTDPPPPPEEALAAAPALDADGIGALVWWRIRRSPLAGHPTAKGLEDAQRYCALREAVHGVEIARIASALAADGVRALVAKGWAIARAYPARGLRPPGDVDLFLAEADFEAGRRALPANLAVSVDLHRGCPYLPEHRFEDLLARAERVEEVLVLAPEDHLRLLCLHALKHGIARPLWLCDLAVAVETRGPSFDWSRFLTGDPRRTAWAVCALELAALVLDARLPDPRPWGGARLPQWAVPAVLRAWDRPYRPRSPIAAHAPRELPRALLERWPNPFEAAFGVGAALDDARLPVQVAECLRRTASWLLPSR